MHCFACQGTIEENLRMAKPDATEKEMEVVLEKVNLLGFLQIQDGLQTKLLEKAGNLSGGQCQRLVLARALLRDSAVYIFDEATSNIDEESEELIMQVMIHGLLDGVAEQSIPVSHIWLLSAPTKTIIMVMIVIAVLRGIFHYAEQYCNHFIAFKLLAIIRHKVFAALRKLCPAKLEGRDKGNLISIITTDIELLEVFYTHTISPIAIAILTSLIMVIFIGKYHWIAGLLALAAYLMVGVVIPMWNGKRGSGKGMEFRTNFGELNSFVLDSLRRLDETIQYGQGEKRKEQMAKRSENLSEMQKSLSKMEGAQRSVTNLMILLASFGMLLLTIW